MANNKNKIIFLIIFFSCIFIITILLIFNNFSQFKSQQKPILFLKQEIVEQATAITVKIKLEKTYGSGILINKEQNIYSVITNSHVISRGEKYYIQTPDGYDHKAKLVVVSKNNDLAILEFTSNHNYTIATINNSSPELGGNIFAVGFPFNSNQLQISSGKLLLQIEKPLKGGYQIGYTNEIQKGMSGGAILNSLGEVVGVNGRMANPIIPNYQFHDGSYPDDTLQQQMVVLSWGIPINN